MTKRGLGSRQISEAKTAENKILKALHDGEWYRYTDLKKETGLSSATLSKHLKVLEKGILERKLDLKSKEYPHPVYYRLNTSVVDSQTLRRFQRLIQDLQLAPVEQGHIRVFIHERNKDTSLSLLSFLERYFSGMLNKEELNQALEYLVFESYKEDICGLVDKLEAMKKKGKRVESILSRETDALMADYESLQLA